MNKGFLKLDVIDYIENQLACCFLPTTSYSSVSLHEFRFFGQVSFSPDSAGYKKSWLEAIAVGCSVSVTKARKCSFIALVSR